MKTVYVLYVALLALCLSAHTPLFAQQKQAAPYSEEMGYRKEFAYGINFNTIGGIIGGVYFKYAHFISPKHYHHFGLETNYVKSNSEDKLYLNNTNYNYVKLKRNYLFALRPMYGHEFRVFRKAPEQGIQVNLVGAVGPTLGVLAPYLVEYQENKLYKIIQNRSNLHQDSISRTGFISESIARSSLVLGGSLKLAATFEFGVYKQNVSGIEMGYMLDVYSKAPAIMYDIKNKAIMSSIYITFYYGFRRQ